MRLILIAMAMLSLSACSERDLRQAYDVINQTSATRYYGDIVKEYNSLPLVSDVDPDLDLYATEKAVAGLFVLIAEEETNIRANPAARTTRLLQRVFGSLD